MTEANPSKHDRLIAAARDGTPAVTIVAHPLRRDVAAGRDRRGRRRR